MDSDRLSPPRTGLGLRFIEKYRYRVRKAGTLQTLRRLSASCRQRGARIFHTRGNQRADGAYMNRTLMDVDAEHRPWSVRNRPPLRPAWPPGGRPDPPRARTRRARSRHLRFNAFHQTPLNRSLGSNGINTILIAGGSTHAGLAATVYGACDRGHQVIVVRDGCHVHEQQRLFFLDHMFPRLCLVRTVEQVFRMLDAGADGENDNGRARS